MSTGIKLKIGYLPDCEINKFFSKSIHGVMLVVKKYEELFRLKCFIEEKTGNIISNPSEICQMQFVKHKNHTVNCNETVTG